MPRAQTLPRRGFNKRGHTNFYLYPDAQEPTVAGPARLKTGFSPYCYGSAGSATLPARLRGRQPGAAYTLPRVLVVAPRAVAARAPAGDASDLLYVRFGACLAALRRGAPGALRNVTVTLTTPGRFKVLSVTSC